SQIAVGEDGMASGAQLAGSLDALGDVIESASLAAENAAVDAGDDEAAGVGGLVVGSIGAPDFRAAIEGAIDHGHQGVDVAAAYPRFGVLVVVVVAAMVIKPHGGGEHQVG